MGGHSLLVISTSKITITLPIGIAMLERWYHTQKGRPCIKIDYDNIFYLAVLVFQFRSLASLISLWPLNFKFSYKLKLQNIRNI